MKALVTGAAGLIGANIVRALLDAGQEVRGLVRAKSDTRALADVPVERVVGDVRDRRAMLEAARGCGVIFHAAVHFAYGRQAKEDTEAIALGGTHAVLEAAKRAGVRRVVVTSSSVVLGFSERPVAVRDDAAIAEEFGQPDYIVAKIRQHRLALELARDLGVDVVFTCPTMSVGPHGTTLGPSNALIVGYLNDPLRMTYPGGCNVVSVCDVAKGHLLVALHGAPGEHYVLGAENFSWKALYSLIAELGGVSPPLVELNHVNAYLAATAEEIRAWWGGKRPIVTREQAGMLGRYYWYEHQRAARLGYAPRPARVALAEALSWLAMSPHVSREVRTTLRLHRDVYTARRDFLVREHALRARVEAVQP